MIAMFSKINHDYISPIVHRSRRPNDPHRFFRLEYHGIKNQIWKYGSTQTRKGSLLNAENKTTNSIHTSNDLCGYNWFFSRL